MFFSHFSKMLFPKIITSTIQNIVKFIVSSVPCSMQLSSLQNVPS